MVSANFDTRARTGRIVLQPNRSWSWQANVLFLGTFALVCLVIGTAFFLQGLWLVLPFSLLEAGLVAIAFYYCSRRSYRKEVLTFSEDELLIERGIRRPTQRQVFKRLFARVFVRRPRHPWYPVRVAVRSHGQEVEIGEFLNPDDKDRLIRELRQMVERLEDVRHPST